MKAISFAITLCDGVTRQVSAFPVPNTVYLVRRETDYPWWQVDHVSGTRVFPCDFRTRKKAIEAALAFAQVANTSDTKAISASHEAHRVWRRIVLVTESGVAYLDPETNDYTRGNWNGQYRPVYTFNGV